MTSEPRILCLDRDPDVLHQIRATLQSDGVTCQLVRVSGRAEMEAALKAGDVDLVLADYPFPGFEGGSALVLVQELAPKVPVVLFARNLEDEGAIEMLREGATDYVHKQRPHRLISAVRRALREAEERDNQERAKESLRESEERFRQLSEAAFEGVLIHNNGLILNANQTLCSMFGYELPGVLGMHVINFIQRSYRPLLERNLAAGYERPYELEGIRRDGSTFPMELRAKSIPFRGMPVRVVTIRDITERKQAERALRESELKFRTLADSSPSIIFIYQGEKLCYANPAAEAITGYTQEELKGMRFWDLLHPSHQMAAKEQGLARLRGEAVSERAELRIVDKGGQERWLDCFGRYFEFDGKPAAMGVALDITEKKKFEAQLLRTQRLESLGTLAGGIAHDLNNILAPILMAVQMLRDQYGERECGRILDTLETAAQRGAGIVKQVLAFARGLPGERVPTQVTHVVNEILKIAQETFPKEIQIAHRLASQAWMISGDGTQLHQVLLNLCVNARDAMPQGGRLEVSLENVRLDEGFVRMHPEAKVGAYVLLRVTDTGTGIPPDVLAKMYEPFFSTKEPGKGTGLGLSTVHGIVCSHGGFITVYTEVGRGTEFRVYLPAIEGAVAPRDIHPEGNLPMGKGEGVLLAEDEAAICEITKGTLEAYGYKVLVANDGTEAVAQFAAHHDHIHVVVVDMVMPFLGGAATIRALEKLSPGVKVIATSGMKSHHPEAESCGAAVRCFLQKPFTAETLLRTLRRVLDLPKGDL